MRSSLRLLALGFRRLDAPGLHVGVLHCNVGGQPEEAAYSPCSVADLAAAGMDYWALGHIHQHTRLGEGRPWIVYAGSLQAGKSNELGPKGAVVVSVAGETVERLCRMMEEWFGYYHGYDPQFTWWAEKPYRTLDASLREYAAFLRRELAGLRVGSGVGHDSASSVPKNCSAPARSPRS